jgi:hypothetical protein
MSRTTPRVRAPPCPTPWARTQQLLTPGKAPPRPTLGARGPSRLTSRERYHPARPEGRGVNLGRGARAPTWALVTPNRHERGWWAPDHAPREGAGAPRRDRRLPQAIPRHSCLQHYRADWHCAARSPCESKRGDQLTISHDKEG